MKMAQLGERPPSGKS
jgi:hypothetical protein